MTHGIGVGKSVWYSALLVLEASAKKGLGVRDVCACVWVVLSGFVPRRDSRATLLFGAISRWASFMRELFVSFFMLGVPLWCSWYSELRLAPGDRFAPPRRVGAARVPHLRVATGPNVCPFCPSCSSWFEVGVLVSALTFLRRAEKALCAVFGAGHFDFLRHMCSTWVARHRRVKSFSVDLKPSRDDAGGLSM